MMLTSIIACVIIILATKLLFFRRDRGDLHRIPGPGPHRFWSLVRQKSDPLKQHLNFALLNEKYGPIVRLVESGKDLLVVSDYEGIHEVLVKSGREFGGRISEFRTRDILGNSGIVFNPKPDRTWRTLRRVAQKQLRQFGDGLHRLEDIISDVAEDMFEEFSRQQQKPFDPAHVIFDTTLKSIAFLITGKRTHTGDPLIASMREYQDLFMQTTPIFGPATFKMLEHFPFLKYIGFDKWAPYQRFSKLHKEIWETVSRINYENPESASICKLLREHVTSGNSVVTEEDAQSASLSLLFAGVVTTSNTFMSLVNILAHHEQIQERINLEIQRFAGDRPTTLSKRPEMHFTRAFLLEVLRYTTIAPHGVRHRTLQKANLLGYVIPSDTQLITSLWNLHHDLTFWGDPFEFRPERFLDADDRLVAADHPHRTHLMPFGAGVRVCLGESLAKARLFLWTTALVSRFVVSPCDPSKPSYDPRRYEFRGILKPLPYNIVIRSRTEMN